MVRASLRHRGGGAAFGGGYAPDVHLRQTSWMLFALIALGCDAPPATGEGPEAPTAPAAPTTPDDRARDGVSTASTGAAGDGPKSAPSDQDGTEMLATLEARLLAARQMIVEYEAEATGAIAIEVSGKLETYGDAQIDFRVDGFFADQAVSRWMVVDEASMYIRGDQHTPDTETMERDGISHQTALVLGLTRMGVMHNVARLVDMKHPDHYDGDPDAWVKADQVRVGTPELREGVELVPLRFHVFVDGTDSATATVWLHPETGLPVEREQTVDFGDEGTMTVVERYTKFEIVTE